MQSEGSSELGTALQCITIEGAQIFLGPEGCTPDYRARTRVRNGVGAFPNGGGESSSIRLVNKADASEQVTEPRVSAQRVEGRPQENQRTKALLVGLFEPNHGLVLIVQADIH